jgi:hypothetical protein
VETIFAGGNRFWCATTTTETTNEISSAFCLAIRGRDRTSQFALSWKPFSPVEAFWFATTTEAANEISSAFCLAIRG